jgi:hypothetical protein
MWRIYLPFNGFVFNPFFLIGFHFILHAVCNFPTQECRLRIVNDLINYYYEAILPQQYHFSISIFSKTKNFKFFCFGNSGKRSFLCFIIVFVYWFCQNGPGVLQESVLVLVVLASGSLYYQIRFTLISCKDRWILTVKNGFHIVCWTSWHSCHNTEFSKWVYCGYWSRSFISYGVYLIM